jgi:hypothetical protein
MNPGRSAAGTPDVPLSAYSIPELATMYTVLSGPTAGVVEKKSYWALPDVWKQLT